MMRLPEKALDIAALDRFLDWIRDRGDPAGYAEAITSVTDLKALTAERHPAASCPQRHLHQAARTDLTIATA